MSDLGPDTFDEDVTAGRGRIMLPGGEVHDFERMIVCLAVCGTGEHGISMFVHPAFEDESEEVARHLAADLIEWADQVAAMRRSLP